MPSLVILVSVVLLLSCADKQNHRVDDCYTDASTIGISNNGEYMLIATRVDGCRKMHPSSLAINSGSGNWALLTSESKSERVQ